MGYNYRNDLSAEDLRSLVHYDPETGIFTWLPRPLRPGYERTDKMWNTRESGTEAGGPAKDGSRSICIRNANYAAHRLAWLYMTGEWPEAGVDHENGKPDDNRWINLRAATQAQNMQNIRLRADNTSGHRGVSWCKKSKKWYAYIHVNKKMTGLGYYVEKDDAIKAHLEAREKLFTFQSKVRDE